jgi:DNA-directed RNA polymerase specialized sigma24 family protein
MSYNHAGEEKKFKEQWVQKEKLYRENGMNDAQIASIKEYDEDIFKNDRAFYRRTTLLAEPENLSSGTLDRHSDTFLEEYWSEIIVSDEKYNRLMKVPPIMRKAFYMYKVLGLYQSEISSELSIPQQTISYWIVKIAEILK